MKIDLARMIKQPTSMLVNTSTLSKKVFEFDPAEHEVHGHSKNHEHYICPLCKEEHGDDYAKVKLYWNYEKLIGFCFICEHVAILKTDRPRYEVALTVILNRLLSDLSHNPEIMERELRSFSEINYSGIAKAPTDVAVEYLAHRVPIYPDLLDVFRFGEVPKTGVTVPVFINGKIVSYILRFYKPPGKMKYYLPENSKVLYSPTGDLWIGKHVEEITLVEGPFDAIAAAIDGFPNPMAVFGKTITPFQTYLLRSMAPDKINFYLDETELSQKMRMEVRGQLPTVSSTRVIRSPGDDPEERLLWKLMNYGDDYLQKLSENIQRLKG
jgi:hypothetical protein